MVGGTLWPPCSGCIPMFGTSSPDAPIGSVGAEASGVQNVCCVATGGATVVVVAVAAAAVMVVIVVAVVVIIYCSRQSLDFSFCYCSLYTHTMCVCITVLKDNFHSIIFESEDGTGH